tara:strand:+ start:690 stop:1325 length:636 start_codon:yes stop_codon:yes gene_type:complete
MKASGLYAIVDQAISSAHSWDPFRLAETYLAGGAKLIQLRMPLADSGSFLRLCDQVVAAAEPFDATVIVNDRADLALISGAHGVHVGQSDMSVQAIRGLLPDGSIVGLSTHNLSQINETARGELSYVAVGPVFETKTKKTGFTAKGLELVKSAVDRQVRPVFAIGGITLDRVPEIIKAGAAGVAVISDLLCGNQPERRVRDYLDCLEDSAK